MNNFLDLLNQYIHARDGMGTAWMTCPEMKAARIALEVTYEAIMGYVARLEESDQALKQVKEVKQ